jgi:hypothetical protein
MPARNLNLKVYLALQTWPNEAVWKSQGIVGDTYDRFIAGEMAVSDPESQLYLPPDVSLHSLSDTDPK